MKYLFYIAFFVLPGFLARAQSSKPVSQPEKVGKIVGMPVNGTFKGVMGNATAVKHFNNTFSKIFDGFMASSVVANPVGIEPSFYASISGYQPHLGDRRYTGKLDLLVHHYLANSAGVVSRTIAAAAKITVYLNSADFFSGKAGFFSNAYNDPEMPHPFPKIPMTDSTADYEEYSFKSYGFPAGHDRDFAFRIIRKNDQPVFIPFSRKQYLEYLISVQKVQIKENVKNIERFKSEIESSKKRLNDPLIKDEYKKSISQSIKTTEEIIAREQKWQQEHWKNIDNYNTAIGRMSAAEAAAQAFVDRKLKDDDFTEQLVAYGKNGGVAMYVINPAYYDNAQPPYNTQSLIVAYWSHTLADDFLKEKVRRIYETIDYSKLRASMQ